MTPDPLSQGQLLVFWIQLAVLLAAARGLGFVARRLRQPSVLGELTAGLLLGPSVLGHILPDVADWLFPPGVVQDGLLLAVASLGVVFLVATAGFETDLQLVRRSLATSALVPVGSLLLPLVAGWAVGVVVPASFHGENADDVTLALFLAVALGLSALPVVARILLDMGVVRRGFAQVTMVSAMADDVVGWLLLGVLTGAVTGRGIVGSEVAVTLVALAALVVAAFTLGQRVVDRTLKASFRLTEGVAGAFTISVLVILATAAITQAIGVEAVVGAFIAGLLLSRSRYRSAQVQNAVELVSTGLLAPIFFASAGLAVDLGVLAEARTLAWTAVIVAVASATKVGGAYLGGRLTALPRLESLAIGVGLNARGALGIVAATVALNVGVFNERSYTAVVLMAIVTSMLVPPILRPVLARLEVSDVEAARLEREVLLGSSVIANVDHALLPTRGGENSAVAARVLDLVLKTEATVTLMSVRSGDEPEAPPFDRLSSLLPGRRVERRTATGDPASAILGEARYGYGLLAVGITDDVRAPRRLSATLRRLLADSTVPVLVVRSPRGAVVTPFQRIIVPATGTRHGRAAEEVAYALAAGADAAVEVVHVVGRSDHLVLSAWRGTDEPNPAARGLLARSVALASQFGRTASATIRTGVTTYEGLLDVARERAADTIVTATRLRTVEGEPFLGHGTEYVLEHADRTLVLVVFPDDS